jgi:hypothetical protein
MPSCPHLNVQQQSTIYALTDWTWDDTQRCYLPDDAPCTKVMSEDTTGWQCRDCNEAISLEDTGEGAVVEEEVG